MTHATGPRKGFEGTSAEPELAEGPVKSGLEPAAWLEHVDATVGLGSTTLLPTELRWVTHALHPSERSTG